MSNVTLITESANPDLDPALLFITHSTSPSSFLLALLVSLCGLRAPFEAESEVAELAAASIPTLPPTELRSSFFWRRTKLRSCCVLMA